MFGTSGADGAQFPCINNDTSQAEDMYTFLTEFFGANAYPEFDVM